MGMVWVGYRREPAHARQLLESEDGAEELLEADDDEASVDLDKAWHGIHWLLTGSSGPTVDPVSEAIFGGEEVGEEIGYGPARLLAPDRVRAVAAALATLDEPTLRARADLGAMARADVYPGIWDEDDVVDTYLLPYLDELRSFYADAAAAGETVIQAIV